MGQIHRGGGRLGSLALLAIVAALILRPWERGSTEAEGGPAAATASVARVIDGDTIEIELDGAREDVRYVGVDTPETVKPGTAVQCFGPRAAAFNRRLMEGRRVRLVFGVERRDAYGRLLAYAYLGHRFVNATLVRRGLARSLTIAPNDRFAPLFRRLELRAARAGRGLWGRC
jgi:micrococcal nuclease